MAERQRTPKRSGMAPWVRLRDLLATRQREILSRENVDERHIYIYDIGGYWVAFEMSAWLSCTLFPEYDVSIIKPEDYPRPIVMVAVSDKLVQDYFRRHIVRTCEDHTVIATYVVPRDRYPQWRRDMIADMTASGV